MDILFLVPNTSGIQFSDDALRDYLELAGHTVTMAEEDGLPGSASGRDVVLCSSYFNSGTVNTKLNALTVPVIVWENYVWDDMGMATSPGTVSSTDIDIIDDSHPLAAGLTGTVTVYASSTLVRYASAVAGATVVASRSGDSSAHAIICADTGDTLSTGPAPARRVGLFLADNGFSQRTTDGEALWDAALTWATDTGGPAPTPIAGTGLASTEVFGAGAVAADPTALAGTGLASTEAFGAGAVDGAPIAVAGTGLASTEQFGVGAVAADPATLAGSGLATTEVFGAGAVAADGVELAGTGLASTEAFGAGAVTASGANEIAGVGLASTEAFGAGAVAADPIAVAGTGLASTEQFGAGTVVSSANVIAGVGLASTEQFGAGAVAAGPTELSGTGLASTEAFGAGAVAADLAAIAGAGLATTEAFGAGAVDEVQGIAGTGLGSTEQFGADGVAAAPVAIAGVGLATTEAFGVGRFIDPLSLVVRLPRPHGVTLHVIDAQPVRHVIDAQPVRHYTHNPDVAE